MSTQRNDSLTCKHDGVSIAIYGDSQQVVFCNILSIAQRGLSNRATSARSSHGTTARSRGSARERCDAWRCDGTCSRLPVHSAHLADLCLSQLSPAGREKKACRHGNDA